MSTASVQKPEQLRATENEEESFIILGSGPTSMNDSLMHSNSISFIDHDMMQTSSGTVVVNGLSNGIERPSKAEQSNGVMELSGNSNGGGAGDKNSLTSFKSAEGADRSMSNFASRFLLGEINQEAVRSSVFEAFPSINSNQTKVDDVLKLYSLLDEHAQLKGKAVQ